MAKENSTKKLPRKQNRKTYKKGRLLFNQKRNTAINQKNGPNALNISSLDPDHYATNSIQNEILQQLSQKNTHIESIQETHIPQNHTFKNTTTQ